MALSHGYGENNVAREKQIVIGGDSAGMSAASQARCHRIGYLNT
jgi:hypothetical protein